jgi:uncharacterized protein (DUF1015 family)
MNIELWVVEEEHLIAQVAALFEDKELAIADGHHRYGVYAEALEDSQSRLPPNAGQSGILTYLCALQDEGLMVRPVHRLLIDGPGRPDAPGWNALTRFVDATEHPDLEQAMAALRNEAVEIPAWVQWRPGWAPTLCRVRDDAPLEEAGIAFDDPGGLYDANLLEKVVFEHALGANAAQVHHVDQLSEARRRLEEDNHAYAAGFFLRSIPARRIFDLALSRALLPPRCTSFFPKVPSGLVIQSLVGEDMPQ